MDLEDFLIRNNISEEDWGLAAISWDTLQDIKCDFERRRSQLEDAAEFVVKSIQAFEGVHSVRWRVKDSEHLLEKIIRKRSEKNPSKKYKDISVNNYLRIVTDLIGVRALHLFKDQVFDIHERIRSTWGFNEKPISYIREGDHSDLVERFKKNGITPKVHKSGYRSVHYVLKMRPNLEQVLIEVQVRTIFEEGWSEIDHKVRYPNFSDNKQLESILKIFNRLAGSADEMGSFIRGLSLEIDSFEERLRIAALERNQAELERDEALHDAQVTVDELDAMYSANGESTEKIKALQGELSKLREKISASEVAKSVYREAQSHGVKSTFVNAILSSANARNIATAAIIAMNEAKPND
jgi:ppGpp synthetase/RelA/SpoT-type nucleotidyltranferase